MDGEAPDLNFDPLEAAFEKVISASEVKTDKPREAVFLLFHGLPNTGRVL